jgi:SRSO17 transposase
MEDHPPRVRPEPMTGSQIDRFESFVADLRPVFHRADQFLRFRAYLRGLLESPERKNVESIAAAARATMMVETDLAQSLQHFISQSPWDSGRLMSGVRRMSRPGRTDPDAVWVVHDGVFAKKGQHSVGVQRQFARAVGRKINCQVGVFVAQLGPGGYFPIAARLYLPGPWLRDHAELAEKQVPARDRVPASKLAIALQLLDELREDGEFPRAVAGEDGYISNAEFADELAKRGLTPAEDGPTAVAEAVRRFDWLRADFGLDHFEGRTWHGWHHHVAVVLAAYHLLATGLPTEGKTV